jgi:hypothetical protein
MMSRRKPPGLSWGLNPQHKVGGFPVSKPVFYVNFSVFDGIQKNTNFFKNTLDLCSVIWSNAIISLGADEKTHCIKVILFAL